MPVKNPHIYRTHRPPLRPFAWSLRQQSLSDCSLCHSPEPVMGSLCWPVDANSGSNQKETMNMQTTELLPVVINGQIFSANQDRMWNLNEIQKGLGLPDSKSPSKWDNEISRALEASRNFVKVDKVGSFADELGTIAYAMPLSVPLNRQPIAYSRVLDLSPESTHIA